MGARPQGRSLGKLVDELSTWGVGLGTITLALFPLAIPIVLLTVVAVLPLVVIGLVGGLLAAVLALPVLLWRRIRRPGRPAPGGGSVRETVRSARLDPDPAPARGVVN